MTAAYKRRAGAMSAAAMLSLFAGCATRPPAASGPSVVAPAVTRVRYDAGFVATRDTDVHGSDRLRALGPVFEKQTALDGRQFLAIRPFYSSLSDPAAGRWIRECLWPVAMAKGLQGDVFWRLLLVYGHDFGASQPACRNRLVGFPLVWAGRDGQDRGYFALFPLGGVMREFFGREKVVFALWPLYTYSVLHGSETWSFLWPILSWTRGGDTECFRFFPFYGRHTNRGRWDKSFILWPLWSRARYTYDNESGSAFLLFPLFGRVNLSDQKGWAVLPPFFRWSQGAKLTMLNCPWPFVQVWSGVDKDRLYLWPLWGRQRAGPYASAFWLWPFIRTDRTERADYVQKRFRLLPLVTYASRNPALEAATLSAVGTNASAGPAADAAGGAPIVREERYFRLWPLFSYQREGDAARTRLPDLWPVRGMTGIEKNWAPFWTLFTSVRKGEAREHELLWGLFRYRNDGQGTSRVSLFPILSTARTAGGEAGRRDWSLLYGLVGYRREGLHREVRLLYWLKLGDAERGTP